MPLPEAVKGAKGLDSAVEQLHAPMRNTTAMSAVEEKKKFKLAVVPNETKAAAVELAAGTYTIYCDIAGHRQAGMEAKLVVS